MSDPTGNQPPRRIARTLLQRARDIDPEAYEAGDSDEAYRRRAAAVAAATKQRREDNDGLA